MAKEGVENGQQPNPDPTARPIAILWGSQEFEEALLYDPRDPKRAVANSAFERFVPPPTRSLSFRTLTIERNELFRQYSAVGTLFYENKVNGTEFYGFPAETVLCKSITATLEVEGRYVFWRVTYLFWIRLDTWVLKLLDAGLNERIAGKLIAIRDPISAAHVTAPVPLNGRGVAIGEMFNPDFVFIDYNRYLTADFTPLGL